MKIWIIGNIGSGKTRLAREISKWVGTPALHLDRLRPWKDREGYLDSISEWLKHGDWIIEGVYGQGWGSSEISRECDTLIWLDPGKREILDNIVERHMRWGHARQSQKGFYRGRFIKQYEARVDSYWGGDLVEPYLYNRDFHKSLWENHKGPKKRCEGIWQWSDIKNFLNDECKSE